MYPPGVLTRTYVKHNQPLMERANLQSHTTWKTPSDPWLRAIFPVSPSVISDDVGRRVPCYLYRIISTEFACDDFGGNHQKKSVHKFQFIVSLFFGGQ